MKLSRRFFGGLLTALCLFAAPVMAAPQSDTVNKLTAAADAFHKVKAYQFDGKASLSSILFNGIFSFKGEAVKQPASKVKMTGSLAMASVVGAATKEIPVEIYVLQNGKENTVYVKKGNEAWGKYTTAAEPSKPAKADKDKPAKSDKDILKEAVQSAHVISKDGPEEVILFHLDPSIIDSYNPTAKVDDGKLTTDEEKLLNGALYETDYMLTVNKKTQLPTRYEMDCSSLVQKVGEIALNHTAKETKMTDSQKQFANQLIQTLKMKIDLNMTYKKGKDIVLPDEAKNAKEIEDPTKGSLTEGVNEALTPAA
ncbi:MAG: hypothetical protein LKE33_05770 [Acidaminococcus sp.]|jgi:hypothetical protein|nr:hypothetical protein [Acidaminococcus sp.]MCI2100255.1 hypothetical protein [Acidaminococcus sp.]MCI2114575.1 hypothetical protein [Acidaminococcus sp.]MCI2116552.1 hypothetical protein [Acidaminococcus sp.]